MTPDVKTSFLTYYIRSLGERSRAEKSGAKFGFDWIIYNLALADNLTPYRLPFVRSSPTELSKTKTETEFGIDESFLSPDRKTLIIFVLKDEELSNANWSRHDFDSDLRRAAAPDLSPPDFAAVTNVRVVLAYNKDEDQAGIQLFTNSTRALGTKVGDKASLSFERWNLTTLAEKVGKQLLTPSLLPQPFFSLFGYICSQFGDFRHDSDEWANQLVPNWRRFIGDLLKSYDDERRIRLLPVALIILREYAGSNPSAETGWIDLTEWAMVSAWRVVQVTKKDSVKEAVREMWGGFYLAELSRFYSEHEKELGIEHGLSTGGIVTDVEAVASSIIAFWHLARLGLLGLSYAELMKSETESDRTAKTNAVRLIANRLAITLSANPAAMRPVLDLQHIELFLVWVTFWRLRRFEDIYNWLSAMQSMLMMRRARTITLAFIDGRSSLDTVFEYAATGQKPPEFCDASSLLLLCILEWTFCLDNSKRDELILRYYREIILAQDSFGQSMAGENPIDLIGWLPPADWDQKVLEKSLADEGESQAVETFVVTANTRGSDIAPRIEAFVRQCRAVDKSSLPVGLPLAASVLGCLKLRSPLPPELWRAEIFGANQPKREPPAKEGPKDR